MKLNKIINYENAILFTAVVNIFIQEIWFNNRQFVAIISGETYSIYTSALSYMLVAMIILPFSIQALLRHTKLISKQILMVHACSTVLTILVIACLCVNIPPIATNWEQFVFPVPIYQQWKIINLAILLLLVLASIIQVAFVTYVVLKTVMQSQRIINKI